MILSGRKWPARWLRPMSQGHTIQFLRPASFLKSLFFKGLLNELSVSDAQWRIRPWNPIRASTDSLAHPPLCQHADTCDHLSSPSAGGALAGSPLRARRPPPGRTATHHGGRAPGRGKRWHGTCTMSVQWSWSRDQALLAISWTNRLFRQWVGDRMPQAASLVYPYPFQAGPMPETA